MIHFSSPEILNQEKVDNSPTENKFYTHKNRSNQEQL
jgi:hypothetical protein